MQKIKISDYNCWEDYYWEYQYLLAKEYYIPYLEKQNVNLKGNMLDIPKEAGAKPIGIEASLKSAKIGKSAGRNIINCYIGDMENIRGNPFDAFVSFNYLEHLPEPGAIIKNIYNNMTPNAVGFVTVPNLDYLLISFVVTIVFFFSFYSIFKKLTPICKTCQMFKLIDTQKCLHTDDKHNTQQIATAIGSK